MNISQKLNQVSFKEKRRVYNTFGGTSGPSGGSSGPETLKEIEKKNSIKYVPFTGNPETDINELAAATYPNSKNQQTEYATKIKKALDENLKTTKTELWEYLVRQFVTAEAIVDGMLQFYTQNKENNEFQVVKIGDYLKSPEEIKATTGADVDNHEKRLATYEQTKNTLSALLTEIKAAHPVAFEQLGNRNA